MNLIMIMIHDGFMNLWVNTTNKYLHNVFYHNGFSAH